MSKAEPEERTQTLNQGETVLSAVAASELSFNTARGETKEEPAARYEALQNQIEQMEGSVTGMEEPPGDQLEEPDAREGQEVGKNWSSKNSVSTCESSLSYAYTARTNASMGQFDFPDSSSQRSHFETLPRQGTGSLLSNPISYYQSPAEFAPENRKPQGATPPVSEVRNLQHLHRHDFPNIVGNSGMSEGSRKPSTRMMRDETDTRPGGAASSPLADTVNQFTLGGRSQSHIPSHGLRALHHSPTNRTRVSVSSVTEPKTRYYQGPGYTPLVPEAQFQRPVHGPGLPGLQHQQLLHRQPLSSPSHQSIPVHSASLPGNQTQFGPPQPGLPPTCFTQYGPLQWQGLQNVPAWQGHVVSPREDLDMSTRLAGRRGRTHLELQSQSHLLALVQRLVVSSQRLRVDPVILYQSQMNQYMAAQLSVYIHYTPVNFVVPGSYPLDNQSYTFLDILRVHPHLAKVNLVRRLPARLLHTARYFMVMFNNELEIFKSIKYKALKLNREAYYAFESVLSEVISEAGDAVENRCKIYLFFTFNAGKRCVGVAELLAVQLNVPHPVDLVSGKNRYMPFGAASLDWLAVKDIGTGIFSSESSKNSKRELNAMKDDKSSVGSQSSEKPSIKVNLGHASHYYCFPLKKDIGPRALERTLKHFAVNSLLLDFRMFGKFCSP